MGLAFQIAGAAMSVIGQMRQAQATRRRNEIRERQLRQEQRLNEISAKEKENQRLLRLEEVMGSNVVRAISGGYMPNSSGSWMAVKREEERKADKDIGYIQLFGNARDINLEHSVLAGQAETAAAQSSALINSAGTIFNTAGEIWETS